MCFVSWALHFFSSAIIRALIVTMMKITIMIMITILSLIIICRLCGDATETVRHIVRGCKKLANSEENLIKGVYAAETINTEDTF